jgi:hypothetical protein
MFVLFQSGNTSPESREKGQLDASALQQESAPYEHLGEFFTKGYLAAACGLAFGFLFLHELGVTIVVNWIPKSVSCFFLALFERHGLTAYPANECRQSF